MEFVKKSKFGNRFTDCRQGHKHDSKAEALRCNDLSLLEKAGEIQELKSQVTFPLHGVDNIQICKYIADFTYTQNGEMVVEDVKGAITGEFSIKRKLFEAEYKTKIKLTRVHQ